MIAVLYLLRIASSGSMKGCSQRIVNDADIVLAFVALDRKGGSKATIRRTECTESVEPRCFRVRT